MKKILGLLLFLSVGVLQLSAQAIGLPTFGYGFTIKAAGPNSVQVFIKPGSSGITKWQEIEFAVGYPTSCAGGTPPTFHMTVSPALNSLFGVPYTVSAHNPGTSISPGGYSYCSYSLNLGIGSTDAMITSGTEYLVGTITFHNPGTTTPPQCPVSLMDFNDGGSTGDGNTYIFNAGTAGLPSGGGTPSVFYSPRLGTATFYAGAGGYNNSTSVVSHPGGTSASTFATLSPNTALPLKLLTFNASANGCNVDLNWTTADEKDFNYFEVEHSTDGIHFTPVGKVSSSQASSANTYKFGHQGVVYGNNYFRLKMTDIDGSFTYSEVKLVKVTCDERSISLYPNPATDHVTIRGMSGGQVTIYSEDGRMVGKYNAPPAGVLEIDISGYTTGNYIAVMEDGKTVKFVKAK